MFAIALPYRSPRALRPRRLLRRRLSRRRARPRNFRSGLASRSRPGAAQPLAARTAGACSSSRCSRDPSVGRGRSSLPARARSLGDLLDDPLGGELAVAQLRALVLGDRADDRAELREHPPPLGLAEPGRRLDVEERLDARRALLRVLAARPARPRDAEGQFRPNRLGVHGGDSARRRRCAARLGRADPGRRRRGAPSARRRAPRPLRDELDHDVPPPARRAARARSASRSRTRSCRPPAASPRRCSPASASWR